MTSTNEGRTGGAVLGISADYHDAAAALVVDGEIVAAAAEERFTRVKHDPSMPRHTISWCLDVAGVTPGELELVVFYSKPLSTYERVLLTHAEVGPRGFPSLSAAVGAWSGRKLWVRYRIERLLAELGHRRVPIAFAEHHLSHAASAFLPSPFEHAAILTLDGVGEWATSSLGEGRGGTVRLHEELRFPNSLGLFYSAMTALAGFEVNDGEYKLMGLAPFGTPRFTQPLLDHVIDIGPNGEIRVDQRYFEYRRGDRMTSDALHELLGGSPRAAGVDAGQWEADVAASAQDVLERAVLALGQRIHRLTGASALCLAGGVALNCVANRRLADEGPFDDIWIQPAAGDDGGALGAALWGWHGFLGRPRDPSPTDSMRGAFLGPSFDDLEIAEWLTDNGVAHSVPEDLEVVVARALAEGRTVGWFTGAMEFGPRALGHRSILADPRNPAAVSRLNDGVKGRESFRPFAPAVLAERAADWFDLTGPSPYMLMTAPVRADRRIPEPDSAGAGTNGQRDFAAELAIPRSQIPACTHVDHSARVQTVDTATNPTFHRLLSAFEDLTGCPVLLNTSFNRAGEPVVATPADALRCFEATGLDVLVLGNCVVEAPSTGVAP